MRMGLINIALHCQPIGPGVHSARQWSRTVHTILGLVLGLVHALATGATAGLPPTPPVCMSESVVVGAGQTIAIDLSNSCTDVNGNIDLSTMTVVSAPAVGTLTPTGLGTFSYQAPAIPPGSPVPFSFTVADTTALVSNFGTVSITILPQSKCTAAKYKAAGKKTLAKLKCRAKALKAGKPVDPACFQKAEAKFTLKWGKAEEDPDCLTSGDEATVEAAVDGFVNEIMTLLEPTGP